MSLAAVSQKVHKCRGCQEPYKRLTSFQNKCVPCLVKKGKELERKQFKAETRAKKKALNQSSRSWWLKKVEEICNKYVRLRDAKLDCISCDIPFAKWDAGHFRSVGAAPELRFEPLNIHKQCAQCNQRKAGNHAPYRIALIKKIGAAAVAWLEGPHAPKKYTIPELMELNTHFSDLVRQIQSGDSRATN